MRKGRIKITNALISDALQFPMDWVIEEIVSSPNRDGESIMTVSGSDFPETDDNGRTESVMLIVHTKSIRYEVEKI